LWKDVQTYFPEYKILNRGFGGSSLPDLIRYADKIIIPYHPKQIVIYCGENDIANNSTVTGKTVFLRFKKLYRLIRNKLGNVPVAYISMKPSPSRWHLRQKMTDGNKRIERFMNKSVRNCRFISVWNKMLSNQGEPDPDIFLQDRLHLNKKGYVLWQTIIQPFLIK
jgi:lysophospholipase L1-like esterase